jgi:phosphoribosylformylglycinamidine synthase
MLHVLKDVLKQDAEYVWHKDSDLRGADAVVLPGGFSYGDYLRCGAIARFSPVMQAVQRAAAEGVFVLGVCNGFQVLCESGLLPGALIRNRGLTFRCETVTLRVETPHTAFTKNYLTGQLLQIPIAHGEGCYYADAETLEELNRNRQVLFRYADALGRDTVEASPNGSLQNIAGICNAARNVLGLMPHPERAAEAILGSEDGRALFEGLIETLESRKRLAA